MIITWTVRQIDTDMRVGDHTIPAKVSPIINSAHENDIQTLSQMSCFIEETMLCHHSAANRIARPVSSASQLESKQHAQIS